MPIRIDTDAFYSPDEVSGILGLATHTLAKDRSQGTGIRYVKTGKTILYRGADVLAHLEERVISNGSEYRQKKSAIRLVRPQ